jgi:hypothetical protein
MALFRGHAPSIPQYSAVSVSVREAKYTHLGYRIRLSRLHTLNSPFSISFFEEHLFGNTRPQARK